jgi:hypothetical protein
MPIVQGLPPLYLYKGTLVIPYVLVSTSKTNLKKKKKTKTNDTNIKERDGCVLPREKQTSKCHDQLQSCSAHCAVRPAAVIYDPLIGVQQCRKLQLKPS